MADTGGYITVFRTAENDARDEAAAVAEVLAQGGLEAIVLDDDAPGVVKGTYEVRVPASYAPRAEALLQETHVTEDDAAAQPGNASHELDLIPLFDSQTTNSEVESLSIKTMLDAAGIPNVLVDSSMLPNLPHVIQVPRDHLEAAQRLIAEARATGPAAAEEAAAAPPAETAQ